MEEKLISLLFKSHKKKHIDLNKRATQYSEKKILYNDEFEGFNSFETMTNCIDNTRIHCNDEI